MMDKLKEYYGFLLEDELIKEIALAGETRRIKDGETLMDIGQPISHMPLLLAGSIKILREDKEGNELLLYYLERGDTCAMSMTCCIGNKKSEIRAVAEEDSELVMVPVRYMEKWLQKYSSWRSFVLESYNLRLDEMLDTIDSIAFMKMDERLWKHLTDKVKVTGNIVLSNTHQEIANELHTSRVVISRLLKQLEKKGDIRLNRNKIEVINF
jgi:CRP/FNR family transcriptional regulator